MVTVAGSGGPAMNPQQAGRSASVAAMIAALRRAPSAWLLGAFYPLDLRRDGQVVNSRCEGCPPGVSERCGCRSSPATMPVSRRLPSSTKICACPERSGLCLRHVGDAVQFGRQPRSYPRRACPALVRPPRLTVARKVERPARASIGRFGLQPKLSSINATIVRPYVGKLRDVNVCICPSFDSVNGQHAPRFGGQVDVPGRRRDVGLWACTHLSPDSGTSRERRQPRPVPNHRGQRHGGTPWHSGC